MPKNYAHDYEAASDTPEAAKGHRFVLKDENTFGAFGRGLDIHWSDQSEQGLYHKGCRYLSGWLFYLMGKPPIHLKTFTDPDSGELISHLSSSEFVLNGVFYPPGSIYAIRRVAIVENTMFENVSVTNYHPAGLNVDAKYRFNSDFSDMFEIRGIQRKGKGKLFEPAWEKTSCSFKYLGLDGIRREMEIDWSESASVKDKGEVQYLKELKQGECWSLEAKASCWEEKSPGKKRENYEAAVAFLKNKRQSYFEESCQIETDNNIFNRWINNSSDDLRMLSTKAAGGLYPMAGLPWFGTIFGRDSLITAMHALWHKPLLAKGVLSNLALLQGKKFDEASEEEPGKIIHEFRHGEMANLREVPFGSYYGSVDTTPLFVVLAKQYIQLTGDGKFLKEIWQNLKDCALWLEKFGDKDGDGFIEYARSEKGLLDQGWKDSPGAIVHSDGSLAPGPIALCEVQAYVYKAFRSLSWLSKFRGDQRLSLHYEQKASEIKILFNQKFWWEREKYLFIALDGDKKTCEVVSSNPGHCLWMDVVETEKAGHVAKRLMGEELFSGWGIKTLSAKESFHHPISYHNGSVWPHDSAIAAGGLCRYGYKQEALKVFEGVYKAALSFNHERLPELFCGFERANESGPTPFPSACSPQAWTTAIPFFMLRSLLGMKIDGVNQKLELRRPLLPTSVNEISFKNLQVGSASIDFTLYRHGENVALYVKSLKGKAQIIMQPEGE